MCLLNVYIPYVICWKVFPHKWNLFNKFKIYRVLQNLFVSVIVVVITVFFHSICQYLFLPVIKFTITYRFRTVMICRSVNTYSIWQSYSTYSYTTNIEWKGRHLTKPILIISVYGNILVSNLMCYLADDNVYREVSRLQHHCWLTILVIDVVSSVVNYILI